MCIPGDIILYRDIQGILVLLGFPKVMSLYRARSSKHVEFLFEVLILGLARNLKEAIKNTLAHATSHWPTRRPREKSRIPSCPIEGLGKPLNAPKDSPTVRGDCFGFKFVQRDTPAITVGPDTLLQGDGAKGP